MRERKVLKSILVMILCLTFSGYGQNEQKIDSLIRLSQNDLALKIAYEDLEIGQKTKDCKLISKAYSIIAFVNFWGIGNNEKAFKYFEIAINKAEKCKDVETMLYVYDICKNPFFNTQQYDKYKEILLKEEKINPKLINNCWHLAAFGDLYRNIKSLDTADYYYQKAINLASFQNDSSSLMQLYFNYALIPGERGDYKLAVEYCFKGLIIAEKLKSDRIFTGYSQISYMYSSGGDWKNAKKYLLYLIKEDELQKKEQS